MPSPTVLIVPGLRHHVEQHWQTLLAEELPRVRVVPPMGREDLDCAKRIEAIESEAGRIDGPLVVVAHSGGAIMVAHWAARRGRGVRHVIGAVLATPPDFDSPMPEGYPTIDQLRTGGWLPVPRTRLPFASIVAASSNDPLGEFDRVRALAHDWGSAFVNLGEVGHLNPASGFGPWPKAHDLIEALVRSRAPLNSH